jgi:hypothetical protein
MLSLFPSKIVIISLMWLIGILAASVLEAQPVFDVQLHPENSDYLVIKVKTKSTPIEVHSIFVDFYDKENQHIVTEELKIGAGEEGNYSNTYVFKDQVKQFVQKHDVPNAARVKGTKIEYEPVSSR